MKKTKIANLSLVFRSKKIGIDLCLELEIGSAKQLLFQAEIMAINCIVKRNLLQKLVWEFIFCSNCKTV